MISVQVATKDMPSSPFLENHVRMKAQRFSMYSKKLGICKVFIEIDQNHKRKGKIFSVHIDLNVPGKELVVNHKHNEDVYIAIRDAFHAMERQLEKYEHKRKGHVKSHNKDFYENISDSAA
ncbi:ribosome-associated translation inhibitor RaiA [Gammaproteobacteria bacterium]|nr:ribosome-associated translation inhibitor RaiA [Gammaproteobacteria bacterium]